MDFTIYLVCLVLGVLFTLISAVAGHIFDGGHEAGDGDFTLTVIAIFVTAFGGLGVIFNQIEATRNPWISMPLATVGGFAISYSVLCLLRQLFRKTQSSSESKVSSLVGQVAEIITPIPQNGVGEIAYVQAGTRYTAPARTETGAAVASGRAVKITRVVGSQFHVAPV